MYIYLHTLIYKICIYYLYNHLFIYLFICNLWAHDTDQHSAMITKTIPGSALLLNSWYSYTPSPKLSPRATLEPNPSGASPGHLLHSPFRTLGTSESTFFWSSLLLSLSILQVGAGSSASSTWTQHRAWHLVGA